MSDLRLSLCLALLTFTVVYATEQFRDEEYRSPGDDVQFTCKTELLKKYQPAIKARWFKDIFPVNETDRVTVDSTNTLHMTSLEMRDHGLFMCRVIYLDSSLISNEVRLHMGQKHYIFGETDSTMMQSTPMLGIPNVWSIGILLSTCMGIMLIVINIWIQMKM